MSKELGKVKRIIPMKPEFYDVNSEGKPYSKEDEAVGAIRLRASKFVQDESKMGKPAQFGILGQPHWECVFGEVIPADKQPSAEVLTHLKTNTNHEVEMA